jgi:hypothetical protein
LLKIAVVVVVVIVAKCEGRYSVGILAPRQRLQTFYAGLRVFEGRAKGLREEDAISFKGVGIPLSFANKQHMLQSINNKREC